jgi:hypothetical protein
MSTVPMKTYLDPELARVVARTAAAQGRSDSAVIADAIRSRFAADSPDALSAQEGAARRQLGRIETRIDKLIWEQSQVKACLLLFIRVWLEHNPPLEPEVEDSAAASAEARFARFLDLLVNDLTAPQGGDDLGERLSEAHMNGAEAPDLAAAAP